VTNDNASSNSTAADELARRLKKRGVLGSWEKSQRKLRHVPDPRLRQACLGHVVELGIDAFMDSVTQKAVCDSKQAIWDYDP
ncbi:hypothetical protein K466DRAFT_448870, partial [Polyporus arcularius HHB13444]